MTGPGNGFYLGVCVSPLSPRWFHVLIIGAPLYLHRERFSCFLRYLMRQLCVVPCPVMGLAIPGKIRYPEIVERNIVLVQSALMPYRKAGLLERAFPRPVFAPAPVHGANEPAHYIVRWYWHRYKLEQRDQVIRRGGGQVFYFPRPLAGVSVVIHADIKCPVNG